MKQTFISAYGKVIHENDKLFIQNVKPTLSLSQFARFAWHVLIIIQFILYLFEEASPKRNVEVILFGFMSIGALFTFGDKLYKLLFK